MFSNDSLHVNYTGFLFLQQSPTRDQSTHSSVPLYTPKAHPPPSVFMPAHQGGDRLSPGSLDMRLTAELNRLEYMEESVRQLTDVERTRAVSLAQQETVSLAQILKVSASCETPLKNILLKIAAGSVVETSRFGDEHDYEVEI